MSKIFAQQEPVLFLAPMQEVCSLEFWDVLTSLGGPDFFVTEYFRVHRDSRLKKKLLRNITENKTGRGIVAQILGEHIPSLLRTAKELQEFPIVGIDLNLGCPAPGVCRKGVGGGLLKKPERLRDILMALRENISCDFTVKTRLGYEKPEEFEKFLPIFAESKIDALILHARTVRSMYNGAVDYSWIARAVREVSFPVVANGNIVSPEIAQQVLKNTGARGLMMGRGAIRNPWLFFQTREFLKTGAYTPVKLKQVLHYVHQLYEKLRVPTLRSAQHVAMMKKYMNFIAQGVSEGDEFLKKIRKVSTEKDFFILCDDYLNNEQIFTTAIVALSNSGNPRI
ncbi:MAG: tRNA dihydrouridine synthase [Verrucomicrobiota bacterium]